MSGLSGVGGLGFIPSRRKEEVPSEMVSAAQASFDKASAGNISWDARLPLGLQVASAPLKSDSHPDGFQYEALFPAGALAPGVPPDASGATEFYVRRSGGLAGLSQLAGPFKLEKKGEVSDATRDAMLKAFDSQSNVKWNTGMLPLGQQFASAPLRSDNHPDGFSYTAMIPTGALNPSAPQSNPNEAKEFYVVRSGGFAGINQWAGPFRLSEQGQCKDEFSAAVSAASLGSGPVAGAAELGELQRGFKLGGE